MITTNSDNINQRIKTMRLHGINRDIWDRYRTAKPNWYYEVVAPGFKYNMSDIMAAIGIHQLHKVDQLYTKRREMMMRKAVFRDMEACVNCKTCIIACKVKHMSSTHPVSRALARPKSRNLLNVYQCGPEIRGDRIYQAFVSIACMHCQEAPCIRVCPVSAIYKDTQTSITLVDREKCIGCMSCVEACPHEPSRAVWDFEEEHAQICDLCTDTPFWNEEGGPGGKQGCVEVCPVGAISFTHEIPVQKGHRGYEVNLRGEGWKRLGFPIT